MPIAFLSKKRSRKAGNAEDLAFQLLHGLGLASTLEYRFHPTRKWKFDVAVLGHHLAIEIEGGLFLPIRGRHNQGAGMRADIEKYNAAVIRGWRLLRVLPEWIPNGQAFGLVEAFIKAEPAHLI